MIWCRMPSFRDAPLGAGRPAGQITSDLRKRVKPRNKKYFAFPEDQIGLHHLHPVPTRGALAIATNVGRGCDGRRCCDRRARQRRTAKACGPDAPNAGVKLVEAIPLATVTTSPARRGDHAISRKAIAQGMSDVLRCPVCSCAPFLHYRT